MSEDYDNILDQNVDKVKNSIRDLESPDFDKLLGMEKEGKDRKTVKEFLEKRIEQHEEEVEEKEEEIVEEIEEETSGGVLGSFAREKVLAGGVIAGIVIGLLVGFSFSMEGTSLGDSAKVEESINEFYTISGNAPESVAVNQRNGMYYTAVNLSQTNENGTSYSTQNFYVSPDGELLFPEVNSPFLTSPYDLNDLIQRARQRQATGNTTNSTQ